MTKVGLIKFLLLVFTIHSVQAQKTKYKDIFGLLSTKQYEQAEPFLKKYLKENDDNPNAFLFMGIIYQEKSVRNDILKQTAVAFKNIDSAIFFYDKAKKTINEKEIKKNDEYYQAYKRRDLRTGQFGVQLSDIQFDLDKRMEGLRERKDRIKMVKYYFTFADSLYRKTNALYCSIQKPYTSSNDLYLQSGDSTILTLDELIIRFDSTMKFTENYIASMQNVGGTNYKPSLRLEDIEDFSTDGINVSDFYQNEIQLWDYKKFSIEAKNVIVKEINPMREHLLSFDTELNKLNEKLKTDSTSVITDLTRLTEELLSGQLKKFDSDPLPLNVFSLKIANLEYKSVVIENNAHRDSADVQLQMNLLEKENKYLHKLDSIAAKLLSTDLDKATMNYQHFVTNAYNNPLVLKNYITGEKEFAEREKALLAKELLKKQDALRWVIVDSTSVPLFLDNAVSTYKPLIVQQEKYTVGLSYLDSLNVAGYFYSITPSRRPDIKVDFPVDQPNFKLSQLPNLKVLTADNNSQIYYVLIYATGTLTEKYPSTLAKIYRSDGLSWTNDLQLDFIPNEIQYKQDTGDLIIATSEKMLVIDKNGKAK